MYTVESKFGSRHKKGYTYTATSEKNFKTKKDAQSEIKKMKKKTRNPHVKQKFSVKKSSTSGW